MYNDVADRENVDPFASSPSKSRISQLRAEETGAEETDGSESSFETVIRYNSKSEWSQSTPATAMKGGRKSMAKRKSMKRKSPATTGLYPQLSVYPDISGNAPTTSTEDFGKIAQGIVEEMNTRIAGTSTSTKLELTTVKQSEKPITSPPREPIFHDILIPLKESPFITNPKSNHRFSEAHNNEFNRYFSRPLTLLTARMDSIKSHYAAQRDPSESPVSTKPVPPIRIPKRPISNLDTPDPSSTQKRMRNALVPTNTPASRFLEGRREESMSEHGRDIQNLTRQEFQKRLQMKLAAQQRGEDSVEMESRRVAGKKTNLGTMGEKFGLGNRGTPKGVGGKVIPVKHGIVGAGTMDDSPSLSAGSSRDVSVAIKPPGLSAKEPTIVLVPGDEPTLPQDKKVPTKHTPKPSKLGSRALVIPAAKPAKKVAPVTRSVSSRSAVPTTASSTKPQFHTATFTMGSIPTNTKPSPYRKSHRITSRTMSPAKPRVTRNARSSKAVGGKELTIRPVRQENKDIQVPVKFDGARGKRKFAEADEASPTKRIKLNEVILISLI